MAIVTDLEYNIENRLQKKLDLMILRCVQEHPEKDALLINEGGEGEGKSNSSVAEAYYVKYKTGRDIHLFFRLEEMMNFAKTTEKKIIIWDEPSLDSLGADQMKALNRNLLRLFMTIRKKRHFFIVNFTKFYKFPEYIVVDRGLGLIHMYSRKEVLPGRFIYIQKKKLEYLWNEYRSGKKRSYMKYKSFAGNFPDILSKHFDKMGINVNGIVNATLEQYSSEKDKAIESIGEKKESKDKILWDNFKKRIGCLIVPIKTRVALAKALGTTVKSLDLWARMEAKALPVPIKQVRKLENERYMDNYGLFGMPNNEDDDEIEEKDDKNDDFDDEDELDSQKNNETTII